jgi:hypothetical protein
VSEIVILILISPNFYDFQSSLLLRFYFPFEESDVKSGFTLDDPAANFLPDAKSGGVSIVRS